MFESFSMSWTLLLPHVVRQMKQLRLLLPTQEQLEGV
jgi:hypothetical protein